MLLSRYSFSSQHTALGRRGTPCRRVTPVGSSGSSTGRTRTAALRCQAARQQQSSSSKKGRKAAPRRSGFGKNKGFAGKPQEDWEAQLLPPYRVYYKQGYKPPRFQGTLKPTVFEGV